MMQTSILENVCQNASDMKKKKCMATFLAHEINITEGDITGPIAHAQIMQGCH